MVAWSGDTLCIYILSMVWKYQRSIMQWSLLSSTYLITSTDNFWLSCYVLATVLYARYKLLKQNWLNQVFVILHVYIKSSLCNIHLGSYLLHVLLLPFVTEFVMPLRRHLEQIQYFSWNAHARVTSAMATSHAWRNGFVCASRDFKPWIVRFAGNVVASTYTTIIDLQVTNFVNWHD